MSRPECSTTLSTSVAHMFWLPLEQEEKKEVFPAMPIFFPPSTLHIQILMKCSHFCITQNTKQLFFFNMREGKHKGLSVLLRKTPKLDLSNSYVYRKWKTIIYHLTSKTIFSNIRLLAAKCLAGLLVNHKREHLQLKHQCQAMISTQSCAYSLGKLPGCPSRIKQDKERAIQVMSNNKAWKRLPAYRQTGYLQ